MFKRFLAALHVQAPAAMLAIGTRAPDFAASNQHGATVRSRDLAGERWVLWFFPKADTPG